MNKYALLRCDWKAHVLDMDTRQHLCNTKFWNGRARRNKTIESDVDTLARMYKLDSKGVCKTCFSKLWEIVDKKGKVIHI